MDTALGRLGQIHSETEEFRMGSFKGKKNFTLRKQFSEILLKV